MSQSRNPDVADVAAAVQLSVRLLVRSLRQVTGEGELSLPEMSALARLDRTGPTTSAALAREEQISPQSMGSTLGSLEERGLVERRADPGDGRRVVLSITPAGFRVLRNKRSARAKELARALSTDFTKAELRQLMAAAPLIERLAQRI
ncbi:MAG TPA: MarR family transcriptional regulator [Mycobacteriales bacterium]|nr:MarR family transcriptional regulator [Mycobacteriales bacterium]